MLGGKNALKQLSPVGLFDRNRIHTIINSAACYVPILSEHVERRITIESDKSCRKTLFEKRKISFEIKMKVNKLAIALMILKNSSKLNDERINT